MSKYTADFKLEVIKYYLSGSGGYGSTGVKYNLDCATVRQWVSAYRHHGVSSIMRKYSAYTADFKESVLLYMRAHRLSYRETSAKFDIRNRSAIVIWERAYNLGGLAALTNRKRGRTPMKQPKPLAERADPSEMTPEELKEELAWLRMENDYLKKLDALIRKEKLQVQQPKRK